MREERSFEIIEWLLYGKIRWRDGGIQEAIADRFLQNLPCAFSIVLIGPAPRHRDHS